MVDQIRLLDLRIKTGITVIICGFSSRGVFVDMEQTIVLTISGDRSCLEEGKAVLALKGRHFARGKLGDEFGGFIRGKVYVDARFIKGEASNGCNSLDLDRID